MTSPPPIRPSLKSVLIINDDPLVARAYSTALQAEGVCPDTVAEEGFSLKAFEQCRPDVVLLDLSRPGMSGVEIIHAIRRSAAGQHLPIVVVSNPFRAELVAEVRKAGASRCLNKADSTPRAVTDAVLGLLTPAPGPVGAVRDGLSPAPPSPATINARSQAQEAFHQSARDSLASLRRHFKLVANEQDAAAHARLLSELYGRVRFLANSAAVLGARDFASLASALEALILELSEKPKHLNPSTLRTVAQAIDFLADWLARSPQRPEEPVALPPRILVVDDEPISRQLVCGALEQAGLHTLSLDAAVTADEVLRQNQFDLILLDVHMPGMSGHDLCASVRKHPGNIGTPVIFVSGLSDFTNRARSTLSGGTDFIAKPFLLVELTVKALVYLFARRLKSASPVKQTPGPASSQKESSTTTFTVQKP